ncbi:MAG TPA: phosphoribosylamine--glycine ligase [Myxococcota bacterium]|nr:phosphoribosylamine--glycine ligase [Myxococcota bacterium]HQK51147.1 phosphoribosylamine--glycine ligase [Myxococcota bacterium]
MKVLVVGHGGREHALAWRLSQSPGAEVLITKGNGGTDDSAKALPVGPNEIDALVETAVDREVGLVVVGPETPLAMGLADRLQARGIPVFGPVQAAARIESSKSFAKTLMLEAGVPTARHEVFDDPNAALRHLLQCPLPVVVKADGLAAGKGVVVAQTRDEAVEAVKSFMVDGALGHAGRKVVVEEFLQGDEASLMVITDGERILPLPGARDHKRVFDGDEGPNTGGMGAYSPTALLEGDALEDILRRVIRPVLEEMGRRGIVYQGVLYAGLIITPEGPKVLEFNCRFGDPETQPLMMRLKGNLLEALHACTQGRLGDVRLDFLAQPAITVVLATAGYPDRPRSGDVIEGIDEAAAVLGVRLFHAGTRRLPDGTLVTAGGRVLGVTALGDSFREARGRAYEAAQKVRFAGRHFRTDIGARHKGPF